MSVTVLDIPYADSAVVGSGRQSFPVLTPRNSGTGHAKKRVRAYTRVGLRSQGRRGGEGWKTLGICHHMAYNTATAAAYVEALTYVGYQLIVNAPKLTQGARVPKSTTATPQN